MSETPTLWILVADDRQARLLHGRALRSARAGRIALSPTAEWANAWAELDHDLGADSPLRPARDGSLGRRAELLQRTVADLGQWIADQVRLNGIGELEVFATGALIGSLRRAYPGGLVVREHVHDLARLERHKLESHPALLTVLHREREAG